MIVINQNYYQPMREARIAQGLTQKELGQRSGIPYYTIQSYERGRTNPPARRLRTLAETLGLDVEDYPLPPKRTPADERNELLKEVMDLPGYVIRDNWPLVVATGMEIADLTQELLLRALQAIETYDPNAGASLRHHVNIADAEEQPAVALRLIKLAHAASNRGMTHVPRGVRVTFCSVEAMTDAGLEFEG